MLILKFYGFEGDEVARKLLPLSSKQGRHCLDSSAPEVSTARFKRKLKLFLNNVMRMYVTLGTCIVILFAKSILAS